MSYFADLTPHTYTRTDSLNIFNIGWLDVTHPFTRGEVPSDFVRALELMCQRPVHLHRGFHTCQFCPKEMSRTHLPRMGNGQIRVVGDDGVWYSAPTMVYHYVIAHGYKPPEVFVSAVLRSSPGVTDAAR